MTEAFFTDKHFGNRNSKVVFKVHQFKMMIATFLIVENEVVFNVLINLLKNKTYDQRK